MYGPVGVFGSKEPTEYTSTISVISPCSYKTTNLRTNGHPTTHFCVLVQSIGHIQICSYKTHKSVQLSGALVYVRIHWYTHLVEGSSEGRREVDVGVPVPVGEEV